MRTNSLPMKPAPPVTSSRISDVLDAPAEPEARIVIGYPSLVGIRRVVRLGHVVVEDDVAEVEHLVAVSDEGGDGHHLGRVLAEDHGLDATRRGRALAEGHEDHAGVALHDVPIVPLAPVPMEGLDQLRRVSPARVSEAARHLSKGVAGDERSSLVVEVPALELLDEVPTLVDMLV